MVGWCSRGPVRLARRLFGGSLGWSIGMEMGYGAVDPSLDI
jgi:hypothetical protein